jgi:hypothetical protein
MCAPTLDITIQHIFFIYLETLRVVDMARRAIMIAVLTIDSRVDFREKSGGGVLCFWDRCRCA